MQASQGSTPLPLWLLAASARPQSPLGLDYDRSNRGILSNFDSILVIVDRLTKFVIFAPTYKTATSADLLEVMHNQVFAYFGLPDQIVSDHGRTFVSELWQTILKRYGVHSSLLTAYHPQTNGQTEHMNQSLEVFLQFYCSFEQDNWSKLLSYAMLALNARPSSTMNLPPSMWNLGFLPKVHPDLSAAQPHSTSNASSEMLSHAVLIQRCETSITVAAECMAASYNKSRTDISFAPGDEVMLCTKNLQLSRPSRKLSNPLAGPFKALKWVGKLTYRLDLPATWKQVHPIFHVSLLEPTKPLHKSPHAPGVTWAEDEREEFKVEAVLKSRHHRTHIEYLVQWVGYSKPSWIPEEHSGNAEDLIDEFHLKNPSAPAPIELVISFGLL